MLTQVRLIIAAVVAVVVLVLGAGAWWQWNAAKSARARAVVAEQGQQLATQTTAIVERVVRSEITIHTQAEEAADVVQSAPGASAPLDPGFRDQLCAAVGRLRDGAQACDDQPAAGLDPSPALP